MILMKEMDILKAKEEFDEMVAMIELNSPYSWLQFILVFNYFHFFLICWPLIDPDLAGTSRGRGEMLAGENEGCLLSNGEPSLVKYLR